MLLLLLLLLSGGLNQIKSEIRGFVCDADADAEKALSFVENRKYNLADAACGN